MGSSAFNRGFVLPYQSRFVPVDYQTPVVLSEDIFVPPPTILTDLSEHVPVAAHSGAAQYPIAAIDPTGYVPLFFAVTSAVGGVASFSNNILTFTPNPLFAGAASVTFTVTNSVGVVTTGVRLFDVAANAAPTFMDSVPPLGAFQASKTITLSATDADNDPVFFQIVTPPAHGVATLSGNSLAYTPEAGFFGDDPVVVRAYDAFGGSTPATFTFRKAAALTAFNTEVPVAAHVPSAAFTIPLDPSISPGAVTYSLNGSSPSIGAVSLAGNVITGFPPPLFSGTATTDFIVTETATGGQAFGRVTWDVAANAAPVIVNQTNSVTVSTLVGSLTVNATDADTDALTYGIVAGPTHGTAAFVGNVLQYTPPPSYYGPDSTLFAVSDNYGGINFGSVDWDAVHNYNPTLDNPGVLVAVTQHTTPTQFTILAHSLNSAALTYTITSPPAHGTATISGNVITFTPTVGYVGPDVIGYTVTEARGLTSSSTVSFDLQNTAPVVNNDGTTVTFDYGPPLGGADFPQTKTFTINSTDTEGDVLTYSIDPSSSIPGLFTVTIDGNVVTCIQSATTTVDQYASVVFKVEDGYGGSVLGSVTFHAPANALGG